MAPKKKPAKPAKRTSARRLGTGSGSSTGGEARPQAEIEKEAARKKAHADKERAKYQARRAAVLAREAEDSSAAESVTENCDPETGKEK